MSITSLDCTDEAAQVAYAAYVADFPQGYPTWETLHKSAKTRWQRVAAAVGEKLIEESFGNEAYNHVPLTRLCRVCGAEKIGASCGMCQEIANADDGRRGVPVQVTTVAPSQAERHEVLPGVWHAVCQGCGDTHPPRERPYCELCDSEWVEAHDNARLASAAIGEATEGEA